MYLFYEIQILQFQGIRHLKDDDVFYLLLQKQKSTGNDGLPGDSEKSLYSSFSLHSGC
jgi:hypothetical protein